MIKVKYKYYLNGLGTGSFDGFITSLAKRLVHLMVMASTIRSISKDVKGLVGEGALTSMASETGCMPFALQFAVLRTDSFLLDGLVAPAAFGKEEVCKVGGTVDTTVLLNVAGLTNAVGGLDDGFAAVVALQVVIVPSLSQSIDGGLVRVDRPITPRTSRKPPALNPQLLLLPLPLDHPGVVLITVNATLEFMRMASRVEGIPASSTFEALGMEVANTVHLDGSVGFRKMDFVLAALAGVASSTNSLGHRSNRCSGRRRRRVC